MPPLGFPVLFRSATSSTSSLPLPIDVSAAQHSAIVALVDGEMVVDTSRGWGADYLTPLWQASQSSDARHRVIPVALSSGATSLTGMERANFIRAYEHDPSERLFRITMGISHEIHKLLAGAARPLRIFVSHAKADGIDISQQIKRYIEDVGPLKAFFDVNDIPYGSNFAREIAERVEDTSLLVVQTDAYSTRLWCQREVLTAKQHGRPVVVVNAVESGEVRSFPYLGNVPTVRWRKGDDACLRAIVSGLLDQSLRVRHAERSLRSIANAYGIASDVEVMTTSPELITMRRARSAQILLYPDPPLGVDEVAVLRALREDLMLATPTTLPLLVRCD